MYNTRLLNDNQAIAFSSWLGVRCQVMTLVILTGCKITTQKVHYQPYLEILFTELEKTRSPELPVCK